MSIPSVLRLSAARKGEAGAVHVERLPIRFAPEDGRVIALPFLTQEADRLRRLLDRVAAVEESEVAALLDEVCASYCDRHPDLHEVFRENCRSGAAMAGAGLDGWSSARCELLGAYMTMEYAFNAAALFNPSIVPHADQSGLGEGELRFIISLRATGEGHVSSIVFRTGVVDRGLHVRLDAPATKLAPGRIRPDKKYLKHLIVKRLTEMNTLAPSNQHVLEQLPEEFTLRELVLIAEQTRPQADYLSGGQWAVDTLLWLARSNYRIDLGPGVSLTELVIFPTHDHESRGMEDVRLVRFVNDDGSATYFGTYTAYNGVRILPMMLQTADFRSIEAHSLNGRAAVNKGMALFPRRIGGHYMMCSRIDGENLYLSSSDFVHFWEEAAILIKPTEPWELRHIGNCGSPIETPEGWLLLTHGVGPMRGYAIGVLLLDLNDPSKIRGRLRRPLLAPEGAEREGYVPNVVYSCGSLVHGGKLFMPYAQADRTASMAVVDLNELLRSLIDSGP